MNFGKAKHDKLKPIIAIASAIIVITTVYLGSYYYRLGKIDKTTEVETAAKESEFLSDDKLIIFTKVGSDGQQEIYYRITVGEMRKNFRVDNIKEKDLISILETKGFKKNNTTDGSLSFAKLDGEGLQANKYYIGDKDGYIAIYKTDKQGKAFIENESDVSFAMTEHYPKPDVEKIKNFERVFETREECEDALSDYVD